MNLLKVDKYKLTQNKNKKFLKIFLNKSNIKKNDIKINCFSGGGIFIINNKYVPIIRRSNTAKSNKNKLSTGSGKPSSLKEIYNPRLLIRELFEEISFIKNDYLVIFKNYINKNFIQSSISNKIYRYLKVDNKKIKKSFHNIIVNKSVKFNTDELIIILPNNKQRKIKCMIHIDEKNEVNILFVINLKIGLIKNKVIIKDTEFHDKKKFINSRDIFLVEKNNDKYLLDNNFCKSINFNLHLMTGHLKYSLKKINFI